VYSITYNTPLGRFSVSDYDTADRAIRVALNSRHYHSATDAAVKGPDGPWCGYCWSEIPVKA
jgi:hypothetical protein